MVTSLLIVCLAVAPDGGPRAKALYRYNPETTFWSVADSSVATLDVGLYWLMTDRDAGYLPVGVGCGDAGLEGPMLLTEVAVCVPGATKGVPTIVPDPRWIPNPDGPAALRADPATKVKKFYRFDPSTPLGAGPKKNAWVRIATPTKIPPMESRALSAGLYWMVMERDGALAGDFVFAGKTLCNDIKLAPPVPAGQVATCVPGNGTASARYVPDPALIND